VIVKAIRGRIERSKESFDNNEPEPGRIDRERVGEREAIGTA
jgi:hypothetical protein